MEIYNSKYWKLTVFFQKIIGLWSFHKESWKYYLPWIYVYSFTMSFMIVMGLRLYNEIGVNLEIVIENTLGELYLTLVFLKLTLTITYRKELKKLYEDIARDWKVMAEVDELNVMHKYTEIGRKSARLYSFYMILGVTIFLSLPIFGPLFDIVMPLANGTRPKALPYYAEYGIDLETHYYPLITQAIFGGVGTVTVFVTYDLGFIMTVQHVVALFELVHYRLYKASKIASTIQIDGEDCSKKNSSVHQVIIKAIELHQTVLNYVDEVDNSYNLAWMLILFISMIMIGGGTFILIIKTQPEEIFRYFVVLLAEVVHFYFIFLPGQKIINCSSEIFFSCYGCQWYNLSEKTKSLIRIMMLRSSRTSELTGGKIFTLCMETYCEMMKTGFSIFTLLKS